MFKMITVSRDSKAAVPYREKAEEVGNFTVSPEKQNLSQVVSICKIGTKSCL